MDMFRFMYTYLSKLQCKLELIVVGIFEQSGRHTCTVHCTILYIFYSTVGTLSDKVNFNIVEINNNMKLAISKKKPGDYF